MKAPVFIVVGNNMDLTQAMRIPCHLLHKDERHRRRRVNSLDNPVWLTLTGDA